MQDFTLLSWCYGCGSLASHRPPAGGSTLPGGPGSAPLCDSPPRMLSRVGPVASPPALLPAVAAVAGAVAGATAASGPSRLPRKDTTRGTKPLTVARVLRLAMGARLRAAAFDGGCAGGACAAPCMPPDVLPTLLALSGSTDAVLPAVAVTLGSARTRPSLPRCGVGMVRCGSGSYRNAASCCALGISACDWARKCFCVDCRQAAVAAAAKRVPACR